MTKTHKTGKGYNKAAPVQHTLADCVSYAKNSNPLLTFAPDLLEACKGLLSAYAPNAQKTVDDCGGCETVLQSDVRRARAAIARAEGGDL